MKTTETVKTELYKLFDRYNDCLISDNVFIKELHKLCRSHGKKSYWWRFFENDTLANDENSVKASLQSPTNRKYLHECIEIALSKRQVEVFYS